LCQVPAVASRDAPTTLDCGSLRYPLISALMPRISRLLNIGADPCASGCKTSSRWRYTVPWLASGAAYANSLFINCPCSHVCKLCRAYRLCLYRHEQWGRAIVSRRRYAALAIIPLHGHACWMSTSVMRVMEHTIQRISCYVGADTVMSSRSSRKPSNEDRSGKPI
jgi:hypothetical protein